MKPSDQSFENIAKLAKDALGDRARLLALDCELDSRIETAKRTCAEAKAAGATADTQAILAPEAERPDWATKAEAETMRADAADRDCIRFTNAKSALPGLLARADREIESAYAALTAMMESMHEAARNDLAREIREVAARLGTLLQLGHALAAAGVTTGQLMTKTTVSNPISVQPFITGHTMTITDETIQLDSTWREDAAAVALFDRHMPYTVLKSEFRPHVRRIHDDREREQREINRAARARSFANPPPQRFDNTAKAAAAAQAARSRGELGEATSQ